MKIDTEINSILVATTSTVYNVADDDVSVIDSNATISATDIVFDIAANNYWVPAANYITKILKF
jgi:hypothetical protein